MGEEGGSGDELLGGAGRRRCAARRKIGEEGPLWRVEVVEGAVGDGGVGLGSLGWKFTRKPTIRTF